MEKITILALHLGYGGIERCISSLANTLDKEYEINIISTYKLLEEPAFKINNNINIKYLIEDIKPNKKELLSSFKRFKIKGVIKETINAIKILYLKKHLMIKEIKNLNCEAVITTRDIHNLWVGKYCSKEILKIGWEHNHHNNNKKYINKIKKSVKNLDYFVLVSNSLKEFYQNIVKVPCVYIPNSLDEYPLDKSKLNEKSILSVGRISKEKGYTDLINIFNIVSKKYPDWILNIVGDGPEFDKIKDMAPNSVIMHGFKDRDYINNLLEKTSIYVMTSFSESFGIVLLEAFSYGIPCIAFDSAVGATELISNNWDGYLIENRDIEKFAKKIIELIKTENRRIIMGNNAVKKAAEYNIENIKNKWLEILKKAN